MTFWMITAEVDGQVHRFCGLSYDTYKYTLEKIEEKAGKVIFAKRSVL